MEFFQFELRYWLRGFMVYIFLAIMALLFGFATGSDNVQIGAALGNTYRNSPYVIMQFYIGAGLLSALMTAAIFDSAASRDFTTKFSDILFSKPVSKWQYLVGRFSAATIISLIPSLGILVGMSIAGLMPNRDVERWGAFRWDAHLTALLFFALPSALLFGSVVFAIATWTRNSLYSFLGVLLLMVAYGVSQSFASDISNEWLASMIDPLGGAPFSILTKYWTVDQRNHFLLPISSVLLFNRALWVGVAMLVFAFASWRFSFATGQARGRKSAAPDLAPTASQAVADSSFEWPKRVPAPSWFAQFRSCLGFDIVSTMRSPAFVVILCAAILNTSFTLFASATEGYGLSSFPVTYKMIDLIRGSLFGFLIPIITYFVGVVIWRDRDCRIQEIVGATPIPNSVFVVSRLIALLIVILTILACVIGLGCFVQTFYGYNRLQLNVYAMELIGIEALRFGFFIVLATIAHTFSPNKYVGYFAFVMLIIVNAFLWTYLRIDTLLVRFGRMPTYVYSDMFGVEPYWKGTLAFAAYWIAVSAFALWVCTLAMHRGIAKSIRTRLAEGFQTSSGLSKLFGLLSLAASVSFGGWLYYNTHVLNTFVTSKEQESRQVQYEKKYSQYEKLAQPKITKLNYEIDIFPETRNMRMNGMQSIENKSNASIEKLIVNIDPLYKTTITIPGTTLELDDKDLAVRSYAFNPPMEQGATLDMEFVVETKTQGIENQVSNASIVQNGTFFNNSIAPHFGYDPNRRVMDPNRRKSFELEPAESVPELTRECGEVCRTHYIGNDSDLVDVETVISTAGDQTAVAPGSLVEKWTKEGRNYFRYRLDHPSLNFYSFISARYDVARSKAGDVDVEVYYHPEHAWNVPRMSQAVEASLDYCTREFGPYRHKQARIIEFPRVASFAQAFPGTMPYSESIGFIARLNRPDDIDMVYYIVAHEMAHQWWAHQVIGARMQGATLLSETMAQYSALMMMRKEYGADMMHKFLKYEMDAYLGARGSERLKERPLLTVDPNQGYIHYRKGSLALYYLAEMIGENRINAVLKEIVEKFAYKGPPYPSSYELVDRLREQTPDELKYLIKDLFEDITIFANRTISAKATAQEDGKYNVHIEVECSKFKADEKGLETETDMNDWMEIGAFAAPESGKRYGKLLHRQRIQLTNGKHELDFVVDEKPYQAGIDPRNLMIDRIPDDNLKRITIQ
jgi:ABC-2 type transport system permease protein